MQVVLLKCVMPVERSIALFAPCNSKGRSHLLHNLLKRSIALITQFTQKVDRTYYTIYSKGRSHV
ncbi:MAG: hypothetical protein JGK24_32005 [Microcoleus sp. PH2017_29_MFU_D_A]|uniref:hypothetical protein n=1 Tax=unclassified Microcoleus TaxID=2642155 RepID=UPI001DFC7870|nr:MULTISPECIES: hypothetical protein [unclassified Microcoleus]MCC3418944.1 hypothetical protein [Microcoleus sp. PH2017_07_MST_O_A]MCC3509749.1 hypothetical protein [Microcoleus sp. PH2017_17_BER_D_A]MCC3427229.1 hypothetical protein [Microcoleus sp. PH2017_01_SCD_O_A]MCC3455891.1 hypothetical protein [Microcoleus sp. PH2017_08_TRC_O_A]MCC3607732.1 hypothetical protein [Microcoleus sp. PH2017_29_MFU_D_A]